MPEDGSESQRSMNLGIDHRGDAKLNAKVPEDMYKVIEEESEELGMPMSATARYFIQLGRKLAPIYDPRRAGEGSIIEPSSKTVQAPTPFHEYLPKDQDNAITADEFSERISDYIYDICREDEQIAIDGREVHYDAD